ncbi:MAG: T9SS type A sorting domain-containing protein [Candidatus Marinimicrobia bacterium]|nr:T9SS type A sorting domain-containing protein [Candidatus Neomarinimicrobiota bacterium]
MNSALQRFSSVKLINISIMTLIVLLFIGSSVIYAKKDPNDLTNQPHDFNKFICGTRADHSLHSKALMIHAENVKRLSEIQLAPSVTADFDEGDVAVMVDDGTLIRPPAANPFDLDGMTLLFTPNDKGGYDVDKVAFSWDSSFGTNVGAGDDTNHNIDFIAGFSFPYFGITWDSVFVRSNGNVTFGAIGDPDFFDPGDFIIELPMIAAFFGDLDPSVAGGVFAKEQLTKFTVTWNAIPEFEVSNSNSIQLVLNSNGSFQVSYNGIGISIPANGTLFVGFNSGKPDPAVRAVDFSNVPIAGDNIDILFDLFKPANQFPEVDEIALFNKFYESHDDIYDQIILLTNFTSNNIPPLAFAFYLSISNSIQGINRGIFDFSAVFGSAGRLKGYLNLNQMAVWPDDPYNRFFGDGNNFLTIMGQEGGHRWLSFLRFDQGGGANGLLLGRSLAHWNAYTGFEVTSIMGGGNNWVEISPNVFEVRAQLDYYSNLDQYAIGLRAPEEVPPVFYISSVSNNDSATRTDPLRSNTFLPGTRGFGTRVEVTIEDVIAAEGPRIPARASSQKDIQQAFILLVQQGPLPSDAELNKAKRFVAAWKDYWVVATDGRSTMSTNLNTVLDVAAVEGVVRDASTTQTIDKILAYRVDKDIKQTVAAGGYYTWRTLADSVGEPDGSFTQIISAFPYIPDTSIVPVTFSSTITQDINLTELPTGSVAGTITDSNTGATVEAQVVLHAFSDIIGSFEVEVETNGSGGYTFADLYVTYPSVISYEGITVFPDFPNIVTEIEEIVVEEGIVTTADIAVDVADLLLVNDDPNTAYGNYYTDVLDSLMITYHHWFTAERGVAPAPAAATETGYPIIIWYTGDETSNLISAAEEDSLTAFLDAGGRLFLTGQNIVENLPTSSPLLTNYLNVSHGGNSTKVLMAAVAGNPVTGGERLFGITGVSGANNQTSKDILIPSGIATEALLYGSSGPEVAAVTVDDGNYKIFLTGFGFEGLISGNRITPPDQLMFRTLTWFGVPGLISVEDEVIASLPKKFELEQNYPNPFNPETSINYAIPQNASVKLTIYNILGQKILTLVDEQKLSGVYSVSWNGKNDSGAQVASGLYFYRLEARHTTGGNQRIFVDAKKMLLLK